MSEQLTTIREIVAALVAPSAVRTEERKAAGLAVVLRAPDGPPVDFAVGEFRAAARVAGFCVAAFDGAEPEQPERRVMVEVSVGEPDRDRCGNAIGGDCFRAWGTDVAAALQGILALPESRRMSARIRAVKAAIRRML